MADKLIQSETLQGIANAIRTKDGTSASIQVTDFATRITSIDSDYNGDGFFEKIYGQISEVDDNE